MPATLSPKFELGKTIGTPAAVAAIKAAGQDPEFFLAKHHGGDWGECSVNDSEANDDGVRDGDRILSVYHTLAGVKLLVQTEGDRSSTCIMLPEEY